MTPTDDMFLPENAEKLRLLMERYDKMAEEAITEDARLRKIEKEVLSEGSAK